MSADKFARFRSYVRKMDTATQGAGGRLQAFKFCSKAFEFKLHEEEAWGELLKWDKACSPSWASTNELGDLRGILSWVYRNPSKPFGHMIESQGRHALPRLASMPARKSAVLPPPAELPTPVELPTEAIPPSRAILAAFEQGRKVDIRNPHAIRPWQHVMEPLRGYLTLAEQLFEHGPSFGEGWNFGPNDEDAKPVGWIVEQMAALWGADAQWQVDTGEHPHEAHYLKLDISKARSRLDWHPALRLKDALALIIDWSKQREAGANMRQITLAQLQAYQAITN